jgi:2-haloacid dehalogenase
MIRNVVFDIGGVLLNLRYEPFIHFLREAGADMSDLSAWIARIDLAAHERGEISGQQMLERIAATARPGLDHGELQSRWLDMFEPAAQMFDLARGLMQDYRVYLLSNIGEMHWNYVDSRYGLGSLTHGALASFRVGSAKPSREIYRQAERSFQLEPAATVFIDDLRDNVTAAQDCGWHAIVHYEADATRADLQRLGVRLPPYAGHA